MKPIRKWNPSPEQYGMNGGFNVDGDFYLISDVEPIIHNLEKETEELKDRLKESLIQIASLKDTALKFKRKAQMWDNLLKWVTEETVLKPAECYDCFLRKMQSIQEQNKEIKSIIQKEIG